MTYAALGASALVCALAIWAAARPLQRESISTLLRRVSPTARRGWAVADILAVALAVFGVVGLATRSLEGPLALATPTLVAVAAGLVASRLAVTVAAAAGRARVRRGQVGPALTALALQRRPSLRKVVTVVGWRRPSPSSPPTPCSLPTATARRGRSWRWGPLPCSSPTAGSPPSSLMRWRAIDP